MVCMGGGGLSGSLYSQSPAWEWTRGAQGAQFEVVNDISLDLVNDTTIYIGGSYTGTLDIAGNTTPGSAVEQAYLARTDTLGNHIWTYPYRSTGPSRIVSISSSPFGNVYFIGEFEDSLFLPDNISLSGYDTLVSSGGVDLFIGYMTAAGGRPWYRHFGGPGDEAAGGVGRNLNHLYVTGTFENTCQFGSTSLTSSGQKDAFLAKVDFVFGGTIWVSQASQSGHNVGAGKPVIDGSGVYWGGRYGDSSIDFQGFSSPTLTNIGGEDIFLVKYRHNQTPEWANKAGATSFANGDSLTGIDADGQGIYLTGSYGSNFRVYLPGGGFSAVTLNTMAGDAQFLLSFDPATGNPIWGQRVMGSVLNCTGDVTADGQGNVVVSGNFTGNFGFNGGAVTLTAQDEDGFLVQYSNAGAFNWVLPISGPGTQFPSALDAGFGITVAAGQMDNAGDFAGLPLPYAGGSQDGFFAKAGCPLAGVSLAGIDSSFCGDSLALFANLPASNYMGTWSVLSGPAAVSNVNDPNSAVTFGNMTGVSILRWEVSTGQCSLTDSLVIEVLAEPVADAGLDTMVCGDSTQLTAVAPTGSNFGTWTVVSGGGTVAAPTANNSGISNLGAGLNELAWVVGNTACQDTDTVTIQSDPLIPAVAGADTSVCATTASTFNLYGNNPGAATGEWSILSGTASLADSSLFNSGITVSTSTQLVWQVDNGNCTDRDTLGVNVSTPIVADAGADTTICTDSLVLMASDPSPGTGTWTVLNGSGTFADSSDRFTTVAGLSTVVTSNILQWEVVNAACTTTATIEITSQVPAVVDAGADTVLCDSVYTLNGLATGTNGSAGWSVLSGNGTFTGPPIPSMQMVTGLSAGANEFVLEWSGVCSDTDTVVVVRDLPPGPVDAGMDFQACLGDSIFVGASPLTVGSGTWTTSTPGIVFADSSHPTTALSGYGAGSNFLFWTGSSGVCPVAIDTVELEGLLLPVPGAGADQFLCDTTATTLAGTDPGSFTGTWTLISGPGVPVITSPSDSNTTVSNLQTGTYQFAWTVENAFCVGSDTVSINIVLLPPFTAGPDQMTCDTFATLAATGTGLWSGSSPGLAFSNPAGPNATVSGLGLGVNVLEWTVMNSFCSDSDSVVVTVIPPPVADAGLDSTLCEASNLILYASLPSGTNGLWSDLSAPSGINFANATSPNTAVSGLSPGPNALQWAVTNAGCTVFDTVVIQIDTIPLVDAGPNQELCNESTTQLTGSAPGTNLSNWRALTSGPMVMPPSSQSSVTVNGLVIGVNAFEWTVGTSPACAGSDTVRVTVFADPTGTIAAGPDLSLCGASEADIAADPNFQGMGLWSALGSATFADPDSFETEAQNLIPGVNALVWTVANGPCALSDTLLVTVDSLAVLADAGADLNVCDVDSVALNAAGAGSGNGLWTVVQGNGQLVQPTLPGSQVAGLGFGVNTFAWTISKGACTTTDTVDVLVWEPASPADAGADQELCGGDSTFLAAVVPAVGQGQWSGPAGTLPVNASGPVTGLSVGTNVLVWTVANGTCPVNIDSVAITVLPAPLADAGPDQVICDTFATTLTSPDGSGTWSESVGGVVFSNANDPVAAVSNLAFGANEIIWTVGTGQCTDQDTVEVLVSSPTVFPDAGPDITTFDVSVELSGSDPGPSGTANWSILSGEGILSNPNSPASALNELVPGTATLLYTVSDGFCTADGDTLQIEVLPFTIPTGFSPNGDGVNDTWVIRGLESFRPARILIFNRWGNLVFESADYQNEWDGGTLADDTYYYTLSLPDGRDMKGFVLLKR